MRLLSRSLALLISSLFPLPTRLLGQQPLELKQVALAVEPMQISQQFSKEEKEVAQILLQGLESFRKNHFEEALQTYNKALILSKERGIKKWEMLSLLNIGLTHYSLGRYEKAIDLYQQSRIIAHDLGDQKWEANSLSELGVVFRSLGQYEKAIDFSQQSLDISRELGDRSGEASSLAGLGNIYLNQGQYRQAIASHSESLSIKRDIGEYDGEADSLSSLGVAYRATGQYDLAINLHQQALKISREANDLRGESVSLGNLGNVYTELGQYEQAINFHQQDLEISIEIGDREGELASISNLGSAYRNLSQYKKAIDSYQKVLNIAQSIGNRYAEAASLGNLGVMYEILGKYNQSIDFHQQDLSISREIGARQRETIALSSLGNVYYRLNQYERAIDFHQQALYIARNIGDLPWEAKVLGHLGNAYDGLNQYERAIDFHEQALAIAQNIGDLGWEAKTLNNIGNAYAAQENYIKAISSIQKALTLHRAIKDRAGEGINLSNLGFHFKTLEQPQLGIVFYKASVEIHEAIRSDISGLNNSLQQSYTNTVADDYRALADLLLAEGRIAEAQQVLDLLKLEELRDFTQDTRATWTSNGIAYTATEQPIIDAHNDLIAFGQTLSDCEASNCDQLNALLDQHETLQAQYDQQVATFETTVRDNRYDDELFADPDNLSADAQALLEANPNATLIYPFITDEKLWLLYATPGSVGSIEVPITQAELARTVQQLGSQLQSGSDLAKLQATSQQLHSWLIDPLEEALQNNGIEHLIFVNDRVTRYIPMAALFDGQKYLIERYAVSSVLSPALTDSSETLGDNTNVLGLGLTQAVGNFNPLPAVEQELDAIIRSDAADAIGIYPGQMHLNEAFTFDQLKQNVGQHRILHIATHAEFVPGRPEDSYIVLGNGEQLKIPDIEKIERRLRNLHLVVLSACQTALGGEAGDGSEIAGLSAYFLEKGRAEAVIASLWAVNDSSTSLLMQRFYELLASGKLTKIEALRQAQLSLLYDESTEERLAAVRASVVVAGGSSRSVARTDPKHPFHWAPFILIGNGL
ncbi:MAG: tetratricopeptide repeat protein [Synechococcales cyanobacterium RM1_1_8]|nr:tetratricopeptide repeat protein [Synechococcales cyanobacterium RM1_1_8]